MSRELLLIVFYLCAGVYTARHFVAAGAHPLPAALLSSIWPVWAIGVVVIWLFGPDTGKEERL